MNNFKQNISKFVKGLENKLTDKMITASNETIVQNAKRDEKCKGLKRQAGSKCCIYCMEHEGTYTSEQVDAGELGGRHEACKCKVTPVFEMQTKQQKEASKEARLLIQEARKQETDVTRILKSLEKKGCYFVGLRHRLKSKESLQRKILKDMEERDFGAKEAASNIHDTLRYTFIFDESSFLDNFKRVSSFLNKEGYNYKRIKNTLKLRNVRYRGINALLISPEGYVFELQFHTKRSFEVKEITHPMYEEFREVGISQERKKKIESMIIEISNKIPMPYGVEEI